jgi:2,4'-dihydroxyacetophenone dioxygenase
MAMSVSPATALFDDHNIRWLPLGDLKHFVAAVYNIDEARKIVDFIVKFDANEQIVLHRHLVLTNTFVVQGEHRLYEPNGTLKEIRPVGSYTSSPPGEPHREGGGVEGAVVLYSIRADDERLFELLDDEMNVFSVLGFADFAELQRIGRAA